MAMRINPRHYHNGLWIPEWLLVRPEVSVGAKLVYGVYASFANEITGAAFPAQLRVAMTLGITDRTVRSALKELATCGLIEAERLGKRCTNRYYFLQHEWMQGLNPVTGKNFRSRELSTNPQVRKEGDRKNPAGDRKNQVQKRHNFSGPIVDKESIKDNRAGARADKPARPAREDPLTPAEHAENFQRILRALEPKGDA